MVYGGDKADIAKAEQRYEREYARTGEYGFDMSLDDVARQYGEKGRRLVEGVEKQADDILSELPKGQNKSKGDPVLSGIIDTKSSSNEVFYGRNIKKQGEADAFIEEAHPFVRERYDSHFAKLENNSVKASKDDILRAGTTYGPDGKVDNFIIHSEVVALDKAAKARGVFKEADMQDLLLHNKQLYKGRNGVPPRCVNCWHITDGLKVIGND